MKKNALLSVLCLISFGLMPLHAQVMWNLKGGWMNRDIYLDGYSSDEKTKKENRPDWMAGLELEIPLSQKLNLETGLRFKNHAVTVVKEYYRSNKDTYTKNFDANLLFEVPLRLTYKQQLGEHFSLHAGIGPYFSYITDEWDRYEADYVGTYSNVEWKKATFGDKVQVGLEPSVAINWACLSLGATYNIPCFYKGYKDENKPVVMATLGIRFKSQVWKYVGATLLTIVTVGAAAGYAWEAASSSSSYSSSSYSSGGSYSSGSYSSSSSSGGQSCKYCSGSGECRSLTDKYHCRGDRDCKKCMGKGYDTINGHLYKCGYCNGSGKCKFCGGSGKCKHCGGKGKK